jgi:uncharacterized protein (TIGR03435 family)
VTGQRIAIIAAMAAPNLSRIAVLLAAACRALAQSPEPVPAGFEVASIKPAQDCGNSRGSRDSSPGRVIINCQSLLGLIVSAYFENAGGHLNPMVPVPLIENGPSWIGAELYSVNAKAVGTPSREVMMGPMLQALLEDRFHLKAHFETKGEVPVFVLTVARGGPKLQPFRPGTCTPIENARAALPALQPGEKRCAGSVLNGDEPNINVLDLEGATLDTFSEFLRFGLFRAVTNQTGIQGRYDFHLVFATDETSPRFVPEGATGPSVNSALQQIGLKLERTSGPREVLVIDHAEKPSGN